MEIILAIIGSGAMFAFVEFLIRRHDAKKGVLASIQTDLTHLKNEFAENKATNARRRILNASDAILNTSVKHSKEWFDQLIDDIDEYEKYCDAHASYKNGKTVSAAANIKRIYNKALETNDFL